MLVIRRCYATTSASAAAKVNIKAEAKVKVSALADNGLGYGHSISLVLPVGSRYQGAGVVGASHYLKNLLPLASHISPFSFIN